MGLTREPCEMQASESKGKGADMARVDLHVHSRYSEPPNHWLLQRLGASECYTDPEAIYRAAKARGMRFVTITDHNAIKGALMLREQHPEDVFTGVEVTASFPEDDCRVHILVYGLEECQFRQVDRLRGNLYALRDYLLDEELPHSVAHATFSVNARLTVSHLEKLLLLFDVFEGINGGRNRADNDLWMEVLRSLTPQRLERLRRKHRLPSQSDDPWIKGLTGGSDDHGGIFVGRTYTAAVARTPAEFLASLRRRGSVAGGRHNDFGSLAYTVGKVAYDHICQTHSGAAASLARDLAAAAFAEQPLSLPRRLRVRALGGLMRRLTSEIGRAHV